MRSITRVSAFILLLASARSQSSGSSSCPTSVPTTVPAPVVAAGFETRLVANGLTNPRGIIFDSAGNLLVLQQGTGVQALTLKDDGGACLSVSSSKTVITDSTLNSAITLSHDGKTLYASSAEAAYAWQYNPTTASNISDSSIVVQNMTTGDHTVRTMLLSKFLNGTMIVTRGSTSNLDVGAESVGSGHSQIKAFNLLNMSGPYDFVRDGKLLGWGLRNDEGVAEHPMTGGIFSVEASADQLSRDGVDIHENNPGEKMNYLGTLVNNKSKNQGGNFGYPQCFAAWNVSELPNNAGINVGTQFAIGTPNATVNDTFCQKDRVAPRLAFQAHMTPLTVLFNDAGTEAWISFHGSWDRTPPIGYKVSVVKFANGEPVQNSSSSTALMDIVTNENLNNCPQSCFRPVGLAWDSKGRLFFSSDSTGEIYVIQANSSTTNAASPNATGAAATPSSTTGAAAGQTKGSLTFVLLAGIASVWLMI